MTLEELKVIISAETSGLKKELNSLSAQLNKTQKNVNKTTSKISGSFKKLTAAVSFTAITVGLTKLTKAAVAAASDLEEVQNVVDVAFGSLSDKVEEFAQNAILNFGLSELQAKQFASTFMAMSNGMGITAKNGANMSLQLTALVGDMASFYNVSQDVAATALNSVFTGETETLKKFGVVMTEANLSAFALSQGIKKSYNEMSQAEKVVLRYNYVLKSTQQAQGDFARTSNSWANQTRILSVQWNQFLSILGKGLTQVLAPVLKGLNQILASLISIANSIVGIVGGNQINKASTAINDTVGSVSDLDTGLSDATSSAKELQRTIAGFDELNVLSEPTTDSSIDGGSGGGGNVADYEIDTSKVDGQLTDAQKKIEIFMSDIQAKFAAWKLTLPEIKFNFDSDQALADAKSIGLNILDTLGNLGDFVIKIGIDIGNDLEIGKLANDFLSLLNSVSNFAASLTGAVLPAIRTFYNAGISPLTQAIGEVMSNILQWTSGELNDWAAWFNTNKDDISEFAENLGKVVSPLSTIVGELLKIAWDVLSTALGLINQALIQISTAIISMDQEKLQLLIVALAALAGIKISNEIHTMFVNLANDLGDEGLAGKLAYIEGWLTSDGKLTMAFTNFGQVVKGIFDTISNNTVIQAMTTQWAAATTTVSGSCSVFTRLKGIITTIGAGFKALWGILAANPIILIIAAIAALIAIFIHLYQTNEEFRNQIQDFYHNVIEPIIKGIQEKVQELWEEYLKPFWEEHLKPLLQLIGEASSALVGKLKELWDKVLAPVFEIIFKVLATLFAVILEGVANVIDFLVESIENAITILEGIIEFLTGVFTGDWKKAWNGIKKIFSGVWNQIKNICTSVMDSIVSAVETVINAIKSLFGTVDNQSSSVKVTTTKKTSSYKNSVAMNATTLAVPQLAKGGVIKAPTIAMMGEYAGANRNPEIVAPQTILQQTLESSNSGVVNAIFAIGNQISKTVEEKNTDIYMDTAKITRRITKEQTAQKKQMGTSLVMI